MKNLVLLLSLGVGLFSILVHADDSRFPMGPVQSLTPGSLCDSPSRYRYPEKVAYCERSVDTEVKKQVMVEYDKLGFQVTQMDRQEFKIDHYIPLCAGGSNHADNLWPQHKSIYVLTDEIEMEACLRLSEGKIRQFEVIQIIRDVKNNLSTSREVLARLKALK